MKFLLTREEKKVIFLSSLGGALEFYDFIIYVFLANALSQLFFPATNHFASLMGVFAIFAIGYLIRPLGGVLLSHFGDTVGRKKTFIVTLLLMALPTFLIGFLPTHESIGIGAPLLLIFLRILQGLSVGGEIPGAVTFTGEHVSPEYRGFACAFIFFGINMGLMLGSLVSMLLTTFCTSEQILAWAWRIPFLLGGFLGFISYYLRKQMTETVLFKTYQTQINQIKIPITEVIRSYFKEVLWCVGLSWLGSVIIAMLFLYLPNYLSTILHYPLKTMNQLNTANLLLFSSSFLFVGLLSDRIGRKILFMIGAFGFLSFSYVLFWLMAQNQIHNVIVAMIAFSIFGGLVVGTYPCMIIESFPTKVRYTGMAFSYNIAFAFFGGLTPLFSLYLIKVSHNPLTLSWYLMFSSFVGLIAVMFVKDKHRKSLH